jgi:broad specificity phosphatase PhoE
MMIVTLELIFVRHGQGVHNTGIPDKLNYINPRLTEKGKLQVNELKATLTMNEEDLFVVSPTIRTIETANILTSGLSKPKKYVTPLVGPRMFPQQPKNPESYIVKCDWTYPIELIKRDHTDFNIMENENPKLWEAEGINTIDEVTFMEMGLKLISWIRSQNTNRAYIIAHDGTITSYRILLGEGSLTRADFLGEAVTHKVII